MFRMENVEENSCVRIYGQITSENVSEVQLQLDELIDRRNDLILDLNHILEIDTAGFYMLFIYRKKQASKNKKVKIMLNTHAAINYFMPRDLQLKLIND